MTMCSVLVSVYNGQKFLSGFFNDLLRQGLDGIEWIFLNASPDPRDEESINKFIRRNPKANILYVPLESNKSVYEAWNIGIKKSSCNILTNWNIDDRRFLGSLRMQIKDLKENKDIDLNYGQTLETTIANEISEFSKSSLGFPALEPSKDSMLKNNSPHCLPVWRKSIHDRFGYFDESYKYCADYDMWLRAIFGGAKFKKLNIKTGLYYRNPKGLSSGKETLQDALSEVARIRKKYS